MYNTGLRRRRTGPNNNGHRNVIRYLQHRGIPVETAVDRTSWQRCEDMIILRHPLHVTTD